MIDRLYKYNNLGTPNYFFKLFLKISEKPNAGFTLKEINDFSYNKIFDDRNIYDGCVPLAVELGFLVSSNNLISFNKSFTKSLISKDNFIDVFSKQIIKLCKKHITLLEIFNFKNFSFDPVNNSIVLDQASFPIKYANFKQLLLDFGIILSHPEQKMNGYILNPIYKHLFVKNILPNLNKRKTKITIEQFKYNLELNEKFGIEAEEFVLDFEKKRLLFKKEPNWIAQYVVNAGYDIASYDLSEDVKFNRFIEVKSYSGDQPSFFWSKNEFSESKRRKENYWLYLVDRRKINLNNYRPIIINNPYNNIYQNDDWKMSIENYKFSYLGKTNLFS